MQVIGLEWESCDKRRTDPFQCVSLKSRKMATGAGCVSLGQIYDTLNSLGSVLLANFNSTRANLFEVNAAN